MVKKAQFFIMTIVIIVISMSSIFSVLGIPPSMSLRNSVNQLLEIRELKSIKNFLSSNTELLRREWHNTEIQYRMELKLTNPSASKNTNLAKIQLDLPDNAETGSVKVYEKYGSLADSIIKWTDTGQKKFTLVLNPELNAYESKEYYVYYNVEGGKKFENIFENNMFIDAKEGEFYAETQFYEAGFSNGYIETLIQKSAGLDTMHSLFYLGKAQQWTVKEIKKAGSISLIKTNTLTAEGLNINSDIYLTDNTIEVEISVLSENPAGTLNFRIMPDFAQTFALSTLSQGIISENFDGVTPVEAEQILLAGGAGIYNENSALSIISEDSWWTPSSDIYFLPDSNAFNLKITPSSDARIFNGRFVLVFHQGRDSSEFIDEDYRQIINEFKYSAGKTQFIDEIIHRNEEFISEYMSEKGYLLSIYSNKTQYDVEEYGNQDDWLKQPVNYRSVLLSSDNEARNMPVNLDFEGDYYVRARQYGNEIPSYYDSEKKQLYFIADIIPGSEEIQIEYSASPLLSKKFDALQYSVEDSRLFVNNSDYMWVYNIEQNRFEEIKRGEYRLSENAGAVSGFDGLGILKAERTNPVYSEFMFEAQDANYFMSRNITFFYNSPVVEIKDAFEKTENSLFPVLKMNFNVLPDTDTGDMCGATEFHEGYSKCVHDNEYCSLACEPSPKTGQCEQYVSCPDKTCCNGVCGESGQCTNAVNIESGFCNPAGQKNSFSYSVVSSSGFSAGDAVFGTGIAFASVQETGGITSIPCQKRFEFVFPEKFQWYFTSENQNILDFIARARTAIALEMGEEKQKIITDFDYRTRFRIKSSNDKKSYSSAVEIKTPGVSDLNSVFITDRYSSIIKKENYNENTKSGFDNWVSRTANSKNITFIMLNPYENDFSIDIETASENYYYHLFNPAGATAKNGTLSGNSRLNLKSQPSGVYRLDINAEQDSYFRIKSDLPKTVLASGRFRTNSIGNYYFEIKPDADETQIMSFVPPFYTGEKTIKVLDLNGNVLDKISGRGISILSNLASSEDGRIYSFAIEEPEDMVVEIYLDTNFYTYFASNMDYYFNPDKEQYSYVTGASLKSGSNDFFVYYKKDCCYRNTEYYGSPYFNFTGRTISAENISITYDFKSNVRDFSQSGFLRITPDDNSRQIFTTNNSFGYYKTGAGQWLPVSEKSFDYEEINCSKTAVFSITNFNGSQATIIVPCRNLELKSCFEISDEMFSIKLNNGYFDLVVNKDYTQHLNDIEKVYYDQSGMEYEIEFKGGTASSKARMLE